MSKKPPPQVLFNFEEDNDHIEEAQPPQESGLKLELQSEAEQNESAEDFESYEDELVKIQEREKPNENDIFENIPSPVKKEPVKQVEESKEVKAKKPRKPMSEEHKQKLALAREKAMLVRKQKAEEKKKMKALDNEEKELLKKQKFKKVQKLKEEVYNEVSEEDSEDKPSKKINNISGLTKKDLEDAQLEAIMKYDAMRKERKAKKKEEQMIEEGKKKMLNNIQRATGHYSYRDGSNRFDNCY